MPGLSLGDKAQFDCLAFPDTFLIISTLNYDATLRISFVIHLCNYIYNQLSSYPKSDHL